MAATKNDPREKRQSPGEALLEMNEESVCQLIHGPYLPQWLIEDQQLENQGNCNNTQHEFKLHFDAAQRRSVKNRQDVLTCQSDTESRVLARLQACEANQAKTKGNHETEGKQDDSAAVAEARLNSATLWLS